MLTQLHNTLTSAASKVKPSDIDDWVFVLLLAASVYLSSAMTVVLFMSSVEVEPQGLLIGDLVVGLSCMVAIIYLRQVAE